MPEVPNLDAVVLPEIAKCHTAVGKKGGFVVLGILQEGSLAVWQPIEPSVALEIGEAMAKEAYVLTYGSVPPENALKGAVVEKKRKVLITRCAIVIRQLQERGKKPEYIAESLVDICLSELA